MTKHVYYINKLGKNLFLFWSYNRFKDEKVGVPAELKSSYTKMPVNYEQSDNEQIYADLNNDSNPLSYAKYQEWIRENKVGHTSMTVGDMIHEDKENKWYVTSGVGFKEIYWIDR